jgi:hypothetical protein
VSEEPRSYLPIADYCSALLLWLCLPVAPWVCSTENCGTPCLCVAVAEQRPAKAVTQTKIMACLSSTVQLLTCGQRYLSVDW